MGDFISVTFFEEIPQKSIHYAIMMDSLEYMEEDAAYMKRQRYMTIEARYSETCNRIGLCYDKRQFVTTVLTQV